MDLHGGSLPRRELITLRFYKQQNASLSANLRSDGLALHLLPPLLVFFSSALRNSQDLDTDQCRSQETQVEQ